MSFFRILKKDIINREKESSSTQQTLNTQYQSKMYITDLVDEAREVGNIIWFPSSLHHRTIPFSTDIDRIVIAFDLIPD